MISVSELRLGSVTKNRDLFCPAQERLEMQPALGSVALNWQ